MKQSIFIFSILIISAFTISCEDDKKKNHKNDSEDTDVNDVEDKKKYSKNNSEDTDAIGTKEWSEFDKRTFRNDIYDQDEFAVFGEYKNDFIDCCLEKCQKNYSSYAEAVSDEVGLERIGEQCALKFVSEIDLNDSWSDYEKRKFRSDMRKIPELSNFGENEDIFIECYLDKLQANYSSYAEADQDEDGCTKLSIECASEIYY